MNQSATAAGNPTRLTELEAWREAQPDSIWYEAEGQWELDNEEDGQ